MTSDVIANLQLAQSSNAAEIATVLAAGASKPSYSVGGRSFSWIEYYRFLLDAQKELALQLMQLQPYSIPSQVM